MTKKQPLLHSALHISDNSARRAFTLIELLVVIAIITILASILIPVVGKALASGRRTTAVNQLKTFGNGATMYANDNRDKLPLDGGSGAANWGSLDDDDAWYNGIPDVAGFTSARELADANDPSVFYNGTCQFYLPGATYQNRSQPNFAFAMNAKLQDGEDTAVKIDQINKSSKTVLFLERVLEGEEELAAPGAPIRRAASAMPQEFVMRYNKSGVLGFVDAHATHYKQNMIFDQGSLDLKTWINNLQRDIIWTVDPKDNPNN
jgi:prepilin-type N-terminal cleavage/methylation domain-containing protein